MALKKSDLYSSLWKSADELRGSMDASQYKDYVLTLLFVKYVSDKAHSDPYSIIEIPQGGSFDDLVALKGKANIGEEINKAIRRLAEVNDLQGVINNADFDDPNKLGEGKTMQDTLSNLIGIFEDIDFTGSGAQGDDLLGDAYEYLMRHFATESGKSKGQFYTPAEVSRVLAKLLEIPADAPRSTTVYDPTCGSGSLLIKVGDETVNGLTIYGQEKDNATWALARMNMILHGNDTADIRQGNTLSDPKFKTGGRLDTFDYFVANPPFSVKTWRNGVTETFGIFEGFAEPPEKNGDYAFLLHMLKALKSSGRGAVILPHGVLFRGNAEATIRQQLVQRGYIKAIIGLPANLFYGTGIPACIIVLDKRDAAQRQGIFMIDASQGFAKDGPKNRLRERDVRKIVDVYTGRREEEGYSRMVPVAEIADPKNDYNLNIPRYIDGSEPEDIQDLGGHLYGGIPERDIEALADYWQAFPSLRQELFEPLREGYVQLTVKPEEVAHTVEDSQDVLDFSAQNQLKVQQWWQGHRRTLEGMNESTVPKDLIEILGYDLLLEFKGRPLISEYAVYEQLMTYWYETMQDDVSLIVQSGWYEAAQPREARIVGYTAQKKAKFEDAQLQFGSGAKAERWVTDILPPVLLINRYFAEQRDELEALNLAQDQASQELTEYLEEHSAEGGLLYEAVNDAGNIKKGDVTARLKVAQAEDADAEEITALQQAKKLFTAEESAKKKVKEAGIALDLAVFAKYPELTEDEVRELVIEGKWGKDLENSVIETEKNIQRKLINRLEELGVRYSQTFSEIENEVSSLSSEINEILILMGVKNG